MSSDVRTYGGWRERRGFGVGGLSGRQTAAALLGVTACLFVALLRPGVLGVMAVPLLLALVLVRARIRGEPLLALMGRHARFHRARRTGGLSYRSAAGAMMPGVLADLQIVAAADPQGREVALAWSPGRGTLTAVVPVEPLGPELVDTEDVEAWVVGWADWLSHLGYVERLAHVAVTIRTGGRTGSRTAVSLTVAGVGAQTMERGCAEALEAVAGVQALQRCGLGVLDALPAGGLVQWIRSGFQPDVEAEGFTAEPRDMRPCATDEGWDQYRHDAHVSTAYAWQEPPDAAVHPGDLVRFLGPADYAKTVTIVFAPTPAHEAARVVERQTQAALFRREYRRRLGRDESARDDEDLRRARDTAREQATGAGLVDVALFAAATVADPSELSTAAADLEHRAGQARLRLRRAYGDQGRVFAAALGVGYLPARWW